MGIFFKIVVRLIVIFISVETIQCVKSRYSFSAVKTKKIKRDSLSSNFNNHYNNNNGINGLFDNAQFFGHQQHYLPPFYSSSGRDQIQKPTPLFSFPRETVITLTPKINIPIIEDHSDGVEMKTELEASFPFTIKFKASHIRELFPNDLLQHKAASLDTLFDNHPHVQRDPGTENNEIDTQPQRLLSRKSRAAGSTGNMTSNFTSSLINGGKKCPNKSFSDRRAILQKMELFTNSFMRPLDNSKACLLRWACEMHANSGAVSYYGLIGEGALLAFSVGHLSRSCDEGGPHLEYLVPFIKAEIDGKSGNCLKYAKKCSQSLFM